MTTPQELGKALKNLFKVKCGLKSILEKKEKLYTKEQMLKFAEKAFDDAWGDDCEYITFPQWLDDNSKFL